MFKALAVPLGILFGAVIGLVLVILAFTVSGWLGLGLIAAVVLALAGYGVWEAKHPPEVG